MHVRHKMEECNMSLIQVNNLTFYYDGNYDKIFENVFFQIDTNWKIGLTGRNGRGKTTLLKLLMGAYEYKGTINSNVEFDYFPYEVADKTKDTIEVIEEVYPAYELWKICREFTMLDLDADILYRPYETLSNGEQTKVLLAVLFTRENQFLLIDEPTNHLDMEARLVVMEYLKRKKGFLLVSHDRYFLDGCVEYILAINKTNIEVMKGNFSTWWEEKEKRDASELAENEKLKKDIRRLSEAAKRTEKWSDAIEKTKIGTRNSGLRPDRGFIGHKSAKMMKRALSMENRMQEAADEKQKLLKDIEYAEPLKLYPLKHHKNTLLRFEDASISYGKNTILEHIDLTVNQGDRIVLKGRNGSGKSSILKLILDLNQNSEKRQIGYEGKIELASGLTISYVSQDTSWLNGSLKEFAVTYGLEEKLFMALLRKLDFSKQQFEKRIEDYSGGQKKKVLIAKSLCERAHLYIWDEPLNFIDIFSRMQIMELVKKYRPTMLLVEHDRYFTKEIATSIISLD